MKIIQSFWSTNEKIEETNFGWLTPKFNAISWTLSSLLLSKFYEVTLYTDIQGNDFLINNLNLPYKEVHIILDELNTYHKNFWALPKIKSYTVQNKPFLHIDGDVFIWEPFPEHILKGDIISQNLEVTTEYYQEAWDEISNHLDYIPAEINSYIAKTNNYACNMGIFGGNDIDFIQKYASKSFEFAEKNKSLPEKVFGGNFNVFFEQVLLYEMMAGNNKESSFLIEDIPSDNEYVGYGNFDEVPFKRTYLHLLGNYKRNVQVCKIMEIYLVVNFPEYFRRIVTAFPDDYLYLNKLDYTFTKNENEQRISNFIGDIKNDSDNKLNNDYLFNRDITCITRHKFFFDCIENNIDFTIKKLKGNYVDTFSQDEMVDTVIVISETDEFKNIISVDELDLLILEKTENAILFSQLKNELLEMLDDDALEEQNDFLEMVENRLNYYLKNRIILIY